MGDKGILKKKTSGRVEEDGAGRPIRPGSVKSHELRQRHRVDFGH